MEMLKVKYFQEFRLTTFGKILAASFAVLLITCCVLILNDLSAGKPSPQSNSELNKNGVQSQTSTAPVDSKPVMPGITAADTPSDKFLESLRNMNMTIYFYPNSAEIKKESYQTLNALVALSNTSEDLTIQIEGNTAKILNAQDSKFDDELSLKRAQAVAKYMTEKGITASWLKLATNGTSKPADSNDSEEGRRLNRRADVFFK